MTDYQVFLSDGVGITDQVVAQVSNTTVVDSFMPILIAVGIMAAITFGITTFKTGCFGFAK